MTSKDAQSTFIDDAHPQMVVYKIWTTNKMAEIKMMKKAPQTDEIENEQVFEKEEIKIDKK